MAKGRTSVPPHAGDIDIAIGKFAVSPMAIKATGGKRVHHDIVAHGGDCARRTGRDGCDQKPARLIERPVFSGMIAAGQYCHHARGRTFRKFLQLYICAQRRMPDLSARPYDARRCTFGQILISSAPHW